MSKTSKTKPHGGSHKVIGAAGDAGAPTAAQAQGLLQAILHSNEVAFLHANPRGILTAWNAGAEKLFGYRAEEVIGKPLASLLTNPAASELEALIERVTRHREGAALEVQGVRKDGNHVSVALHLSPIQDDPASVSGALGIVRALSTPADIEAALHLSEEKFSKVFHTSPDAIILSRLEDGLFLEVNQGFVHITGYSQDDVKGRTSLEINIWCDPKDRERFAQAMREDGQVTNMEARFRQKSGEIRDFLVSGRLIEIKGQACILSVARDISERKTGEEERMKFMLGMERSGEAIFITDPNGVITYVNPTFEKIYGYTKEEAIGQTPRLLKSGAQTLETYQHFWRTILGKNSYKGEFVNKTKSGRMIHVEVSTNPILDEAGKIIGYLAVQRDVSDRKQAEQALRESEEKYRQLFELESDALFLIDNESGQILEANPAASALYGYSRQELLRLNNTDLSAEPDETTKGATSQATWVPVRYHRKKDGVIFPVEITAQHFNRRGRPVHIAAIRDITERLRIQEEITQQRSRFQQLFQNAPIGIVMLDRSDSILSVNPAFEAIFGFREVELAGKKLHKAIVPESLYDEAEQLNADVLNGATIQQETLRARKDGALINVQVYGIPILDEGAITGVYGMYVDITERKRVEEKLQYLSNHDPLTGLFNRFYLDEEMARLENSRKYPVSIIMLDVDEMKDTNDTRGHAEGDELLKRAANLLRTAFRAEDVVARIGGDEFVVLLPETDHETARTALQRVRELLTAHNRSFGEPPLSISMGMATATPGDSLAEILRLADQRMYQEKAAK
ncbi:MAG: PAS domain S-box protein [Anaerolineales bacterium]|nr:PAS domain S-box protein [Anaerolineales bacterium]